jgi:hypothetical protein
MLAVLRGNISPYFPLSVGERNSLMIKIFVRLNYSNKAFYEQFPLVNNYKMLVIGKLSLKQKIALPYVFT